MNHLLHILQAQLGLDVLPMAVHRGRRYVQLFSNGHCLHALTNQGKHFHFSFRQLRVKFGFTDDTLMLTFSTERAPYFFKTESTTPIDVIFELVIFTEVATDETMYHHVFKMNSVTIITAIQIGQSGKRYRVTVTEYTQHCVDDTTVILCQQLYRLPILLIHHRPVGSVIEFYVS